MCVVGYQPPFKSLNNTQYSRHVRSRSKAQEQGVGRGASIGVAIRLCSRVEVGANGWGSRRWGGLRPV